jgi:hypothetical protein
MKILFYIDPSENETSQEIAWHNIQIADSIHHLVHFSQASMAWMLSHPDKNFQDFEKSLREAKLQTHLFCQKPPSGVSLDDLVNVNQPDRECKWMVYFSCRPAPYALQEVLDTCSSYEENFERLRDAGFAMPKELTLSMLQNMTPNPDHRRACEILYNKKKLSLSEIDNKQFFDISLEDIKRELGCDPDRHKIGQTPEGVDLFVLKKDDRILFPYSFTNNYEFFPVQCSSSKSTSSSSDE